MNFCEELLNAIKSFSLFYWYVLFVAVYTRARAILKVRQIRRLKLNRNAQPALSVLRRSLSVASVGVTSKVYHSDARTKPSPIVADDLDGVDSSERSKCFVQE